MKKFIQRSAFQLVVSFNQISILALFVIFFPRASQNPTTWAAEYFLSIAVITPIFMFFGFEMRKRSAAQNLMDLGDYNSKRLLGVAIATFFSIAALCLLNVYSLITMPKIYSSILIFKIVMSINDQISANYEADDKFRFSAISSVAKIATFSSVSLPISFFFSPELGIFIGSICILLICIFYDSHRKIDISNWFKFSGLKLLSDDWFSGIGSFLVSLTVSFPRLMAMRFESFS